MIRFRLEPVDRNAYGPFLWEGTVAGDGGEIELDAPVVLSLLPPSLRLSVTWEPDGEDGD